MLKSGMYDNVDTVSLLFHGIEIQQATNVKPTYNMIGQSHVTSLKPIGWANIETLHLFLCSI
jgi:hypothetical protein